MIKITANSGNVFRRIHDGVIFSNVLHLGKDYSTGIARDDLPEYYEEIPEPQEELTDTEALNIIFDR